MSTLQIAAVGGVIVILLFRLVPWKSIRLPSVGRRSPNGIHSTLNELCPLLKDDEDWHAWKRLRDLATD